MSLRIKAIIAISAIITIACACMGYLGYQSARDGFATSLELKAQSNVKSILEILEHSHPGPWYMANGVLYKGEQDMTQADDMVDYLGGIVNGHVTVFQGDTRIATTVKKATGDRSVGTQASTKVSDIVLKQGKSYTGSADVLGQEYYSAYEPIKDESGKVIGMIFVGLPASDMDDIQQTFILEIIVSTIVIILVLGVIANVVIGRAVAAMVLVCGELREIAAGDLRGEDLDFRTQDEIGMLATAANDMRARLKRLLGSVANSAEAVAASAEQLTANAGQTADSIQHVAENTVEMAESTSAQAGTIDSLQDNIADMRAKMENLRTSAQTMDDAAHATQQNAAEGRATVGQAIEQIQSIADQVNMSAEVVGNLGKRSQEIGSIVDAISEIADQTNLLALNAAIEAARAGEAGRGFAVVADEVRKLAEGCGNAANSISELVKGIQAETESAVQSIESGNQKVREGSESIKATGDAFTSIEQQVDRLSANIRQSINFIGVVSDTGQGLQQAMENVQNISRNATAKAQNVSAATEEQAATMHEMTDASNRLAQLAQDLQKEVHKFKI